MNNAYTVINDRDTCWYVYNSSGGRLFVSREILYLFKIRAGFHTVIETRVEVRENVKM